MNLCPHCGVDVEDAAFRCPLCRQPLHAGASDEPSPPDEDHDPPEAKRQIRRWALEAISLLVVTASVVVLIADLATGPALSWAHYPLASLWYLWVASVVPLLLTGHGRAILGTELAAAAAFLFVLDRFTPGRDWFLPLALPVTILFGAALVLTLRLARRSRRSPFTIIAASMLAAGAFVVGLELLLNHHLENRWAVSWSAVVFACDLPLVALLLYLRKWYRQRQAELSKRLHV